MSLLRNKRWIHFVGIGGIGMSGLAELLLKLGSRVTGSDGHESETLSRLRSFGAIISIGHSEKNIKSLDDQFLPDVVVYSSAVSLKNPELVFAEKNHIPIVRRAEMLAEIMRLKRGLAVAGSHGKTTTTGMISLILKKCGFDPTVVIGGKFDAIGSNAAWGEGDWMVAEADESDGSFLRLSPEIAVVTNIDKEHLDHYKNLTQEKEAFLEFLDRLPFYGRAILCSDCENIREISTQLRKSKVFYGFERTRNPDFLVQLEGEDFPIEFSLLSKSSNYEKKILTTKLSIPGRHNILNATAAILAAHELGADTLQVAQVISEFKGVQRRFEFKGYFQGIVPVVEDYAHHPTEIKATLEAAQSYFGPNTKLHVVFQPHRFSRTQELWEEFQNCFSGASSLLTLPIYAASEDRNSKSDTLDKENFAQHVGGEFVPSFNMASDVLVQKISVTKSGTKNAILVLGAGDIAKLIPLLTWNK
jgi:UDP-N-acetylmuramate--alanine ligase